MADETKESGAEEENSNEQVDSTETSAQDAGANVAEDKAGVEASEESAEGAADSVAEETVPEEQQEADEPAKDIDPANIPAFLQELPVQVDVLLGSVKLSVKELLGCGPGSVIDIGKKATGPFDLIVNGVLIGKGEVVMMHDRLGLKVIEVIDTPALLSSN
ncbi:hypothetical protein BVY03_04190, partial [bacterium K02(2017)]